MPLHPNINWPILRQKVRDSLKKHGITQTQLSKDLAVLLNREYHTGWRHCCSRYLTVDGMKGLKINRPALKIQEAFSNWLAIKGGDSPCTQSALCNKKGNAK